MFEYYDTIYFSVYHSFFLGPGCCFRYAFMRMPRDTFFVLQFLQAESSDMCVLPVITEDCFRILRRRTRSSALTVVTSRHLLGSCSVQSARGCTSRDRFLLVSLSVNRTLSVSMQRHLTLKQHVTRFDDFLCRGRGRWGPSFGVDEPHSVSRGDTVKDDSVSYAVLTEQGSCASQMTVMDVIAKTTRMRRTSSERNISLHPGQIGRCTHRY